MTVSYYVDGESGFVPTITFEENYIADFEVQISFTTVVKNMNNHDETDDPKKQKKNKQNNYKNHLKIFNILPTSI